MSVEYENLEKGVLETQVMTSSQLSNFPIKLHNKNITRSTLIIGLLMAALSSVWLFFPDLVITKQEANQVNDLVNLVIGLPVLLISLWMINRSYYLGWLLLPGGLIYVIYNYLAYLFGEPLSLSSFFYVGLILLSSYTLVDFLRSVNHEKVKQQLERTVPYKIPGGVLVLFGAGFFLLACYQIVNGLIQGTIPPLGENAVSLGDLVVSGFWFIGGIYLLQKRSPGYTFALGLLFVTCTLFIGLILFFFLAPVMTSREFNWNEVIQILLMSMIGFVPTAFYWRGVVLRKQF